MPRDPLSDMLSDLRPRGVAYGHCLLREPWGVSLPVEAATRLHLVVRGRTSLRVQDQDWMELSEGDVALLPKGVGHVLADRPGRPTRPLGEMPREEVGDRTFRMQAGGDGTATVMSCCSVSFGEPALHPLLDLMPSVLLVLAATATDPALPALLDAMTAEVVDQRIGAATVPARLADVVVTRLIRGWIEAQPVGTAGWLSAAKHPGIGRVLAAVHRMPGDRWPVKRLASIAGMSRSVFCAKFAAMVGVPPSRYVARQRMNLAGILLEQRQVTASVAAARLGYGSEAAFSRASSVLPVPRRAACAEAARQIRPDNMQHPARMLRSATGRGAALNCAIEEFRDH